MPISPSRITNTELALSPCSKRVVPAGIVNSVSFGLLADGTAVMLDTRNPYLWVRHTSKFRLPKYLQRVMEQ